MKLKLILFLILFSLFKLNLFSQITFLGFEQSQCNLLDNSPYTYQLIIGGKYKTPGYQILKNGIIIFSRQNFEVNVPYWIEDLKFINDSTGWLVETEIYTSYVKKTSDAGKTWKQIGSGFGDFNYGHFCGFYIVNPYTTFLITSYYYNDNELMISRSSEFSSIEKRFIVDGNISQIIVNDTIYGDPFCIKDTLTFKFKLSTDTINVKINLNQEDMPLVNIISKEAINKIRIFPNPASDYLRIQYDESAKHTGNIYIQDIFGKIVLLKRISEALEEDIYIGNLPEGVYSIKIPNRNSFVQSKFIKINNR